MYSPLWKLFKTGIVSIARYSYPLPRLSIDCSNIVNTNDPIKIKHFHMLCTKCRCCSLLLFAVNMARFGNVNADKFTSAQCVFFFYVQNKMLSNKYIIVFSLGNSFPIVLSGEVLENSTLRDDNNRIVNSDTHS
jgi:hypothetical protein